MEESGPSLQQNLRSEQSQGYRDLCALRPRCQLLALLPENASFSGFWKFPLLSSAAIGLLSPGKSLAAALGGLRWCTQWRSWKSWRDLTLLPAQAIGRCYLALAVSLGILFILLARLQPSALCSHVLGDAQGKELVGRWRLVWGQKLLASLIYHTSSHAAAKSLSSFLSVPSVADFSHCALEMKRAMGLFFPGND